MTDAPLRRRVCARVIALTAALLWLLSFLLLWGLA